MSDIQYRRHAKCLEDDIAALQKQVAELTAERDAARQQVAAWEQHIPHFMTTIRDETVRAARRKAKENRSRGEGERSLLMDTVADIMESIPTEELITTLEKQPCS